MKTKKSLPRFPGWILKKCRNQYKHESLLGDYEEIFRQFQQKHGRHKATCWFWSQIIKSLPLFVLNSIYWSLTMFKNHLKITLRNIFRHKGYSSLNFFGLAIGITCCALILLYIRNELSYDRFHDQADRIYRVVFSCHEDGSPTNANGSFGIGPILEREFPEIIKTVRIRKMGQRVKRYIGFHDKKFYEERFFFAEPSIFSVFNFPLVKGDPARALQKPNTIVITEEMAQKYFPDGDAMGKTLEADPYNDGKIMLFRITGVAKNLPPNSHLLFDFLASYSSQKEDTSDLDGFYQHFTYVLLNHQSSASALESKFLPFLHRHWKKDPWYTISLQPLLDIHLHSQLRAEVEPTGSILYIYIFAAIAGFVLLIAGINFVNLSTARAIKRAIEVSIRKVVGASRRQLINQFLGESILLSFFSVLMAFFLILISLPLFNRLAAKNLTHGSLADPLFIMAMVAIALIIGVVAGFYPALVLSSFKPSEPLKSRSGYSSSGALLRKGLVIFQFAISIGIIFATLITAKQMNYIRSRNLGYEKKQIMVIPLNRDLRQNYQVFRNELLKNPGIQNTTTSMAVPTRGSYHLPCQLEGVEERLSQVIYGIDREFINTYGIKLLAGKNIRLPSSQKGSTEFLISQLTAQEANYPSSRAAVGKRITVENIKGHISGVVNDINIYSLRQEPYSITYLITPIQDHNFLSIRINPMNISEIIGFIKNTWQHLIPNYPLDYFFLDASFEKMHLADKKMEEIFLVFSILAILVACLGLIGLSAYTTEQKTKEIGVRKILGASVSNIYLLLSWEFLKCVTVANLLAWPVAYFAMHKWLENFAYKTSIGWENFMISACMALVVSIITVSYQSIRAATANPVDSLRYE